MGCRLEPHPGSSGEGLRGPASQGGGALGAAQTCGGRFPVNQQCSREPLIHHRDPRVSQKENAEFPCVPCLSDGETFFFNGAKVKKVLGGSHGEPPIQPNLPDFLRADLSAAWVGGPAPALAFPRPRAGPLLSARPRVSVCDPGPGRALASQLPGGLCAFPRGEHSAWSPVHRVPHKR